MIWMTVICLYLCRCPAHNCSGNGQCSAVDGTCLCSGNWTGPFCNLSLLMTVSSTSVHLDDLERSFIISNSIYPSPSSSATTSIVTGPLPVSHSNSIYPSSSATTSIVTGPLPASRSVTSDQFGDHHCETGALAIFVLCILIAASLILHIFFCLRLKVSSQIHEKDKKQKLPIILQESSSSNFT